MKKVIYLPSDNNFWSQGTKVRAYFEGKLTRGILWDSDPSLNIIALKTAAGEIRWSHSSNFTLAR